MIGQADSGGLSQEGEDLTYEHFGSHIIHDLVQLIPCTLKVALFDIMFNIGPFILLTNASHCTTVLLCLGNAAILSVAGAPIVGGAKEDTSCVSIRCNLPSMYQS